MGVAGEVSGERSDRKAVTVDPDVGRGGATREEEQELFGWALASDSSPGADPVTSAVGQDGSDKR